MIIKKPIKTALLFLFISFNLQMFSQNDDIIKGIVKDDEGFELPGVTIFIVSDSEILSSTISNHAGEYELSVPDTLLEFRLKFTYIGFEEKEYTIKREIKENDHSKKN